VWHYDVPGTHLAVDYDDVVTRLAAAVRVGDDTALSPTRLTFMPMDDVYIVTDIHA